jgi:outer membrane receptor for ferrienterochelin and colicins
MFSKYARLFLALLAVGVLFTPVGAWALGLDDDKASAKGSEQDEALQFFEKEATVFVVSRIAEKASEAPGVVRVWTAKEMSRMGVYTLAELANITSGYGVQNHYNNPGFEVRGLQGGGFENNRVLLMVDGINVTSGRGHRAFITEEMPLFFANSVEMLKGPGSALYGTGAFLGVVNVVSKDLSAPGEKYDVMVSAGDPGFAQRMMANAVIYKGNTKFKVFAGSFTRNNTQLIFEDGLGGGHQSTLQDWEKTQFLNASVEFMDKDSVLDGLRVGGILTQKRGGWGIMWFEVANQGDEVTLENFIPFLQYKKALSESVNLSVTAQQQSHLETGAYTAVGVDQNPAPGASSYWIYARAIKDYEVKAELSWTPEETMSFVLGADYDNRYQDPSENTFDFNTNFGGPNAYGLNNAIGTLGPTEVLSGYVQGKKTFDVLAGLEAIAGVRFDAGTGFQAAWSPRVGLVQKFSDEFALKALYGSALIGPGSLKYAGLNPEFVAQNPSYSLPAVSAETINTFESSLVYHGKQLGLSGTFFYNIINNAINVDSYFNVYGSGPTDNFVYNTTGNITSYGVETEVEYKMGDGKIFGNFTWQQSRAPLATVQQVGIPQIKGSLGVMYDIKDTNTSLAVVGHGVGEIDRAAGVATTGAVIPSYVVVDVNVRQTIAGGLTLEALVKNIADTKYTTPLYSGGLDNNVDYPMPGRNFLVSLSSTF